MSGVLAIDTATELCSVALLLPDDRVVLRQVLTERGHADLVLPMVDEVLREGQVRLRDLDGLAFGRGPGGFTGLRIAAGVVQGLGYGANLKVAPVSSLAAVAFLAGGESVLACNDARMNELYWACYRYDAEQPCRPVPLTTERVSPAAAIEVPSGVTRFAGNGIARYPGLRERFESAGLQFVDGVYPRADAIARIGAHMLAQGEGVDPGEALPTYVRDDVARPAAAATVTLLS